MKRILFIILFFYSHINFGQKQLVASKELSVKEINAVFTKELKNKLNIEYSINHVYEVNDTLGKHYLIFTQNKTKCGNNFTNCFNSIKAYCVAYKNKRYFLKWSLKDFLLPKKNSVSEEFSISFWTNYFSLNDLDNNEIIEPIIVYGTKGVNGLSDGKIKIVVYSKGKKFVIRHQSGISDHERITKVDAGFYKLTSKIQRRVKGIMENLIKDKNVIFPYNWQNDMKEKQLIIDEF